MTPAVEIDPAFWGDASERVENYLRAYRVTNRLLLHRLTQQIIEAAARRHAADPARPAVELAAEEAMRLIDAWMERVVGTLDNESRAQRFARGRAAMHLANLSERWPECFLDYRQAPPELVRDLRATYLEAGPDLAFSNMAMRPMDLGRVPSAAGNVWRTFDKWPLLGGLIVWSLFIALLGAAFYVTRY